MGTIKTYNPATGEILAEIEETSEAEVQKAVAQAREALEFWSDLSYWERARFILAARDKILAHLDDLSSLITKESGKPLVESISADLLPTMDLMTFYAKNSQKILRRERIWLGKWSLMGRTSAVEYFPLGVVGIISPWNFPFSIPCGQTVMALMAGNTVVLKPSELTPLIGLKIRAIFEEAGLPHGVLKVIPGGGATGAALVQSGVDKILFTGSVATGKRIMKIAAERLTPVCLELGGKDPMIVLEDADLEVASSAAVWGGFSNSGQICASVERLYVYEGIAERFLQKCVEKTRALRQGNGLDAEVEVGAMSSEMQLKKVEEQVANARAQGAKVLIGGERDLSRGGFFYRPTILTGVNHTMSVMSEETFGPVIGVMTFEDEEEAIRLANDCRFGLTASVWTRDVAHGRALARWIQAGTVTINENVYTYALAQTPWGGLKESGIGRTHGRLGLLELVEARHIHVNYLGRIKDFWWYGYDYAKLKLLTSLVNVLFAKGIIRRFKSVFKFLFYSLKIKSG